MEPRGNPAVEAGGDRKPHIPVMAEEALRWLELQPGGIYVDATAGAGGHSALIAAQLVNGRLIALDRDADAVAMATERLRTYPQAHVIRANYGQLKKVLQAEGIACVDGVLIDAGVSSMQIDRPERGFSFQEDGPLDMRMDTSSGMSAAEWLATVTESDLTAVLRGFGDIGPARRVARAIIVRRRDNRMARTGDLCDAVREALDFVQGEPDEIRTVFQAVRMAVNRELDWLRAGLESAVDMLCPGGRLVVIAFHSGEDRVVKDAFRSMSRAARELSPDGRVRAVHPPTLRLPVPGPLLPTDAEMRANPRSKSARMRVAERLLTETTED